MPRTLPSATISVHTSGIDTARQLSLLRSQPLVPEGRANLRTDGVPTSPDSEQMKQTATMSLLRNSGSVEQIQDRVEFLNER